MRQIARRINNFLRKAFFALLIAAISTGFLPVSSNIKSDVNAQTVPDSNVAVKGIYDFVHVDFADGTSKEEPFLYEKATGKTIKLETAGEDIPKNYVGDEITVTGNLSGDVLTYDEGDNTSLFTLIAEGAGSQVTLASMSGTKSVGVFYVNFVDHRERTMSYESINDYVFRSYKDFLTRSSNGRFSISGSVHLLELDINKTCSQIAYDIFGQKPGSLITNTRQAAENAGINVDAYDYRVVVIDKSLSCDPTGQAYRPANFSYSVGLGSIAHELGHLYGLDHAGAYDCAASFVESTCEFTRTEYWNYMDIMGSSNEHLNGDYGPYHKHQMGWLQGTQVVDVTSGGTYTLERFEDLPGAPGPIYPTKVLRIKTFDGGPAYYVSHRRKWSENFGRREGVTIELSSGDLGGYKRTALLDTTPGTEAEKNDFYDGFLHDGQKVTDPFNGITFEQLSHDTNNAVVRITRAEPSAYTSFMDVNFGRATGYLSALGRKQDVSWSPVTYIVSLKCTSTFLGCPADLGDKITTTSTSGDLTLANGFSYEYSVDIYTKKDGDPTRTARYFWYKANKNNVSCSGESATCSVNVSWPEVTYKVSLVGVGNNTRVCGGATACQDFIAIGGSSNNVSFRGLLAIDGNTELEANVEIADFSGNNHLLQRATNLGKPDDYVHSCSSYEVLTCTIGTQAGIGPFVGNESILVAVKVQDPNGHVLSGPTVARASSNGSYTRNWTSVGGDKVWDYHVVVYPNEFSDCLSAGAECQVQSIYDTEGTSFRLTFSRLRQNYNYRVIICAMTCNSTTGNPKIVDAVVKSANVAFGPSFFPFDPFDESEGFNGEYFDNSDLTNKKFSRKDPVLDFKWGSGSPDARIGADTFSVRWTGTFNFENKVYRFMTTADDGVRVYIDGVLLIDAWNGPIINQGALHLTEGVHDIRVEYKENTGSATVKFGFVKAYECYDQNGDNVINSVDQLIVSKHFNHKGLSAWDLNGDKTVNSLDMLILSKKFNERCT